MIPFKAVVLFISLCAADPPATTSPAPKTPNCPVSGKPANLATSAPTKDGPVFFCSRECITAYRGEPDKFAAAVSTQRTILAARPKVQVKCPVSGDPPDAKIAWEKDGAKVAFCSDECRKKYQADPSRYASALANSFTYQTLCPVMGLAINPTSSIKLPSGETVYFCCKGCDEKLLADPDKYAPALIQQGYRFDFSKESKSKEPGKSD